MVYVVLYSVVIQELVESGVKKKRFCLNIYLFITMVGGNIRNWLTNGIVRVKK